ncbi:MAG: VOC family protein [Roseibium sp.]
MARGVDHIVVAVNDLDAAAKVYEELGFTVTPENRHSWGTANRLVQLDGFFIEILAVADPNLIAEPVDGAFSFGAFNRDFLKKREGASMLVLESADPEEDRENFQGLGLKLFEPFSFGRIANLPDGSTAEVGFDLTFVGDPLSPEIGYFTCHNKFPKNFWKSAFQSHANGAAEIKTVYFVANDPSDHHEFLGGFSGQREMRATSLGLEVDTPRGKISVLNPNAYRMMIGTMAAEAVAGDLPQIAAIEVGCKGLISPKTIPAADLFGCTLIMSPL